jgi:hypothetical protein
MRETMSRTARLLVKLLGLAVTQSTRPASRAAAMRASASRANLIPRPSPLLAWVMYQSRLAVDGEALVDEGVDRLGLQAFAHVRGDGLALEPGAGQQLAAQGLAAVMLSGHAGVTGYTVRLVGPGDHRALFGVAGYDLGQLRVGDHRIGLQRHGQALQGGRPGGMRVSETSALPRLGGDAREHDPVLVVDREDDRGLAR